MCEFDLMSSLGTASLSKLKGAIRIHDAHTTHTPTTTATATTRRHGDGTRQDCSADSILRSVLPETCASVTKVSLGTTRQDPTSVGSNDEARNEHSMGSPSQNSSQEGLHSQAWSSQKLHMPEEAAVGSTSLALSCRSCGRAATSMHCFVPR